MIRQAGKKLELPPWLLCSLKVQHPTCVRAAVRDSLTVTFTEQLYRLCSDVVVMGISLPKYRKRVNECQDSWYSLPGGLEVQCAVELCAST